MILRKDGFAKILISGWRSIALLFELATGVHPFAQGPAGATTLTVVQAVAETEAGRVSEYREGIPPGIRAAKESSRLSPKVPVARGASVFRNGLAIPLSSSPGSGHGVELLLSQGVNVNELGPTDPTVAVVLDYSGRKIYAALPPRFSYLCAEPLW